MSVRNPRRLGFIGLGSASSGSTIRIINTILEIELAVERLTTDELAAFRTWFVSHDSDVWDRQMEADAGWLDSFAAEALADLRGGRCKNV